MKEAYKVGYKHDGQWFYMDIETRDTLMFFIGFLLDEGETNITVKAKNIFRLDGGERNDSLEMDN